ncbi:MAG TPA: prepilin-type N-terminal cleavage/methylation domain-containing protein [Candidatus Cloacimonadota bacterium]|nr:prepilin-type N-terminal cleavage/methylation domain-containing protein [Candidatus Cloacimonadota bacterium]
MRRILKSEAGFSLIELISVMAISTVLILVSASAISVFFNKYKEINAFVRLQTEAVRCLDVLRNGYTVGSGQFQQFYGVSNAKFVEITGRADEAGKGTGIKILPPISNDYQKNDFMHIYLDNKAIRVNYTFNGVQVDSPRYLFPSREELGDYEVTKFTIGNANQYGQISPLSLGTETTLLEVEIEARALLKKGPMPNQNKYKTVNFRTLIVRK